MTPELKFKILRRKIQPEEYRLYKAALEWDLTDPIVIDSADDFKSTAIWRDRLTPYHHQVSNLISFCRRLPVTLLADDVGLGKTISAGLIISELIARSRVKRILIVCPKLLAPQWEEELSAKFNITAKIAVGAELKSSDTEQAVAVITTYNSARLHLDAIPEDRFQMLILDEAHKLRNLYGTRKAPKVAGKFRKALQDRRFRFVLMLTATPIQNRLWDLYSLVDLMAVARGHDNPFGTEDAFIRDFIVDRPDRARQLNELNREKFRSIVYGYMSRVRRGDARLYFPDRIVQMHRVDPTPDELLLIKVIAKPLEELGVLAKISILQALASSPQALLAQLKNMARRENIPATVVGDVESIVKNMTISSKLRGLEQIIDKLAAENPECWRIVVFTGRRETQSVIKTFLENKGIKVGIINGDSGQRNKETLAEFRKDPPNIRVVVSTEAGAEGINLQVANVLVNYDLPWNPMIVEQRIGRIQRLASDHAFVSILNIILKGTFEETIVGRLMEKLQMAAHAIGDIESLLQSSDIGEGEDDTETTFEAKILKLVLAAIAGKDFAEETRLAAESIENARAELDREQENIDAMLGNAENAEYVGPRAPNLPATVHSMDVPEFVLLGFKTLGASVQELKPDIYVVENRQRRERIRFGTSETPTERSTLYEAGAPGFQRLVSEVVATGIHDVRDLDDDPIVKAKNIVDGWASGLGLKVQRIKLSGGKRFFSGEALLRARATVAHDSYERLLTVPCTPGDTRQDNDKKAWAPLNSVIQDVGTLGIDGQSLLNAVIADDAISEFSRFYVERREQELGAAGKDERKRQKLNDDFTPVLSVTVVGLTGETHCDASVNVEYEIDGVSGYDTSLIISPHRGTVIEGPSLGACSKTGMTVPITALARCSISGQQVIRHLLAKSGLSDRLALPKYMVVCSFSGKTVLEDEVETSYMSGKIVAKEFLRTSPISHKRAEPEHFSRCEFTNGEVLKSELLASAYSGRSYRIDEQAQSIVSGKKGHRSEFVLCHETRSPLFPDEAEHCEETGATVRPGILKLCSVTGKRVLPGLLEQCCVTGKLALKRLFVTSSVSSLRLLPEAAVSSIDGEFCTPAEAKICAWSHKLCHLDDLGTCSLTGVDVQKVYLSSDDRPAMLVLLDMLDGARHSHDKQDTWGVFAFKLAEQQGVKNCQVVAAALSPSNECLAICAEQKTLFGLRVLHLGAIVNLQDRKVVGKVAIGKRDGAVWMPSGV